MFIAARPAFTVQQYFCSKPYINVQTERQKNVGVYQHHMQQQYQDQWPVLLNR
jgi:hypothetical protein